MRRLWWFLLLVGILVMLLTPAPVLLYAGFYHLFNGDLFSDWSGNSSAPSSCPTENASAQEYVKVQGVQVIETIQVVSASESQTPKYIEPQPAQYGTPWLGVSYGKLLYPEGGDINVSEVYPYSSAYYAGIQKGDVVEALFKLRRTWDGTYVLDLREEPFIDLEGHCLPGDVVLIVFRRPFSTGTFTHGFKIKTAIVAVGSKPSNVTK